LLQTNKMHRMGAAGGGAGVPFFAAHARFPALCRIPVAAGGQSF
jgi:hypothetical protein